MNYARIRFVLRFLSITSCHGLFRVPSSLDERDSFRSSETIRAFSNSQRQHTLNVDRKSRWYPRIAQYLRKFSPARFRVSFERIRDIFTGIGYSERSDSASRETFLKDSSVLRGTILDASSVFVVADLHCKLSEWRKVLHTWRAIPASPQFRSRIRGCDHWKYNKVVCTIYCDVDMTGIEKWEYTLL